MIMLRNRERRILDIDCGNCDLKKIVNELSRMMFGEWSVFYLHLDVEKVPEFFQRDEWTHKNELSIESLRRAGSFCLLIPFHAVFGHMKRNKYVKREYVSGSWKWVSEQIEQKRNVFLEIIFEIANKNVLKGSKRMFVFELFVLVCFMLLNFIFNSLGFIFLIIYLFIYFPLSVRLLHVYTIFVS